MTYREFSFGSLAYEQEIQLRSEILREPLGLVLSEKDRAGDAEAIHLGAFEGERLIAVLLLEKASETTVRMRQVAVAVDRQSCGIGSALVNFAESIALKRGFAEITAHARESALLFYQKQNYEVSPERFLEITLWHRKIQKTLNPS